MQQDQQGPATPAARTPFGQDRETRLREANKMIRNGAIAFFGVIALMIIQAAMHSRTITYSGVLLLGGLIMMIIGFVRRAATK